MNFYLARSFTRALDSLDKQSAALAKRAALDFQIDPSQPGFKFHRIQNARDRNMWSFRINRDLRAIVHHEDEAFILCYVDHHDEAYAWAERHKIEQHPTTGQTQIVEVVERTEVVTRTVYEDQTVVLPPLADTPPALLLTIGVPTEWVDWVRTASEQALFDHIDRFPEEVQHNLLELLTGGLLIKPPALPSSTAPIRPAKDAPIQPSREIVPIEDADELARALESPWEQWLVFLHPEQRDVVHRSYSGAARVFGSAGTGKTIVALHRVKWLLDHHEDAPMLCTTYTQALTSNLVERLELLLGEDIAEIANLEVTNFHRWLMRWHRETFGQMDIATEQDIKRLIDEGLELHADVPFRADEILSEFRAIIDPYFIQTRAEYFDTPRTGRGKPMGKRQKLLLWKVVEHVLQSLRDMSRLTLNQYSGRAVAYFEEHPDARPFQHVVVDEAQDFSPIELQALRAIVREGEDDLFLCSDAGQRLYGRAFSWFKNGIDIRGRSTQLMINYRTTEQIRAACEALLPEALDGPGDEAESRAARSLRRGDAITLAGCKTPKEQMDALERWLVERIEVDRIEPSQIAVLARKTPMALRMLSPIARKFDLPYELIERNSPETTTGIAYGEMKSAKGLEYRAVAIVDCSSQIVPLEEELEKATADRGDFVDVLEMERNLLYVAGTRARDNLFISYVGAPSQFLDLLIDPPSQPERPPLPEVDPAPTPTGAPEQGPEELDALRDDRIPVVAREGGEPAQNLTATHEPDQGGERIAGVWIGSQFRISPSRIAQYFGMNCQRYLRFSSASSQARILADHVPSPSAERDYSRAIFESGYAWEHEVLHELIAPENLHIAPGDKPLTDRYFSPAQTVDVLRSALPGSYIYEMTLVAPDSFYARHNMDTDLVMLSPCRPDLVEVLPAPEGAPYSRVLRIIDMKRSHSIHASHYIQLAMYALLLEAVLEQEGIDDTRVDRTYGAIWLGGHPTPTPCNLTGIYAHLDDFLRHDVHHIFSAPLNRVTWHVQPKCEWCPYLEHCVIQMNREDDLSRLPRMTHQGKQHLRTHGVYTVADVEMLLDDPARTEQIITPSATLATQRHLMEPRARALNHDQVINQGFMARGLTIPTTTEIKIFLTLQREHLGDHTYALGYEIVYAENVPERVLRRGEGDHGEVLVARTPQEEVNIRRQFVVELYGLLSRVDAYNLGQEWSKKLSVQFFVYSRAEESLLTQLLFAAMEERETSRAARTLLMYFQGPDLILSQEHPDQNVALPVAILLDIVGRVVALPIPVAYTLPETLAALGVEVDYPRDALFHHPFATLLRADAIFEAWYKERPERVTQITTHITSFLQALAALYEKLRDITSDDVHLYMPKFELPLTARIQDPLLSKLAFFAQYEAAYKCAQVRNQRMIARRAVRSSESVHELEALDATGSFRLVVPATNLDSSDFKTWLLVRDDDEGRRAQIQYNDFYYRNAFWGGGRKSAHVAVVKLLSVTLDDTSATVSMQCKYTRDFDGYKPRSGDRFLLYERFSNALMDRNIAVLEALEQRSETSDLLRCVLEHSNKLEPLPMEVAPIDGAALGMTPSQQHAFAHIQRERVLALWGPPGTGKTHFLALTILAMMEAHRQAGKPFRVMIHAFTHAASENVLSKLVALQAAQRIYIGDLPLAKVSGWKGSNAPGEVQELTDKRKIVGWAKKQEQCVIAGTAWAFDKLVVDPPTDFGADLVVMDEASQIKVPEAAIGMNLTHATGRVILAGDHYQLPPIVAGSYPEPPDERVALHRSIFEAVCQVEQGRWMCQLEENFRMNRTLTALSAALIYGEKYRCGTAQRAAQKLPIELSEDHAELVRTVLSPESSMAVVLLHGIPPGKDNEPEAKLVAELALALRECLCEGDAPFEHDADFFARGLFIVSPHHSQIQRIRRHLHDGRSWEAEPFVDTVDKMQGQEAMAVIVSYGVSDPEFAMMEAEFIYSQNRLNVSVTRGEAKTVLLLPAALLHAPPRVLERQQAAAGLGYMRQLVAWVRERGEEAMFLRDGCQIEVLTT